MKRSTVKPLELEDAVDLLLDHVSEVTSIEEVNLFDAVGRVLAEDILAPYDQPPFPRSPLDGYALRSADSSGASYTTPVCLRVIGEVDAGGYYHGEVKQGEAVRIMTGAPIPAGADAIIKQEDTDYGEDKVLIDQELKAYSNYCFQGEDYPQGRQLLKKGDAITPLEAGLLASANKTSVLVKSQIRVLLVSTGDELMMPGHSLTEGKIYDSNLFTLGAQLMKWGVQVEMRQIGDDVAQMCQLLEKTIDDVDLIITTGGVSVGKKDIMHEVFQSLEIKQLFWKVKIKPGMAMLAGLYRDKLMLCLSGNPYAALIDLHFLVRPILGAMLKTNGLEMIKVKAVLRDGYPKHSLNRRYIRAYIHEGSADLEGHLGGNGDIYSNYQINAVIEIKAGTSALNAGDKVDAYLL
ncbi:MAG: molybdopterin molybdotransferase MoeA [bacterium]